MKQERYTAEFKAEAINQVLESGYSVRAVSRRLGDSICVFIYYSGDVLY
ncbi:transposase [bacterium]|nr:transposase [bacterium]